MSVPLMVGAAALVASCGTSKAEEAAKSAKVRFSEGQVCAAATLEPAETSYKAACEAKQKKEKSEREQTEKHEAAVHKAQEKKEADEQKATESKEAAEHKAEAERTKRDETSKRADERKQAAEAAQASETSHPESSGQTVPSDLVGKALPEAESRLDGNGIPFEAQTINGDAVILRGDWGVCSTTPAEGSPVSGKVILHLGHFQCGA